MVANLFSRNIQNIHVALRSARPFTLDDAKNSHSSDIETVTNQFTFFLLFSFLSPWLSLSLSPFYLLQYFCHWMELNNDQKHKHKSKCFCQRFFLCLLLFFLSSLSLYSYASNNIFWFESAYRCLISLSSLYLFRTYTVSTSRNCGP